MVKDGLTPKEKEEKRNQKIENLNEGNAPGESHQGNESTTLGDGVGKLLDGTNSPNNPKMPENSAEKDRNLESKTDKDTHFTQINKIKQVQEKYETLSDSETRQDFLNTFEQLDQSTATDYSLVPKPDNFQEELYNQVREVENYFEEIEETMPEANLTGVETSVYSNQSVDDLVDNFFETVAELETSTLTHLAIDAQSYSEEDLARLEEKNIYQDDSETEFGKMVKTSTQKLYSNL